MANDIFLEAEGHPDWIAVSSPVLKVEAHDLIIDSAERRKAGPKFRRALVHDEADGLTINFANDYPGGVTINGVASITPWAGGTGVARLHNPSLQVHGDITFEAPGIAVIGSRPVGVPRSLNSELNNLEQLIGALTDRVAALEKG